MKKLITVFLVLALVSTALFAQEAPGIGIGAWGRGAFVPLQATKVGDADFTAGAGTGVTWGTPVDLELTFSAGTDNVGFVLTADATGWAGPGVANIWAKPFSFLTVRVGRYKVDTLRGKIGDTAFTNYALFGSMKGEDNIFARFGTGWGSIVELTPVENLFIGASFYGEGGPNGDDKWFRFKKAEDVFKGAQVAAGYTIPGIGLIRGQYIGVAEPYTPGKVASEGKWLDKDGEDTTNSADYHTFVPATGSAKEDFGATSSIQAAFALTAIENLTVDIGARIFLPYEYNTVTGFSYTPSHIVAVGANFSAGALGVLGRVDASFGGKTETVGGTSNKGFGLNAAVVPSYDLGFAVVGADIDVAFTGEDDPKTDDSNLGFGGALWLKKGLGNGYIATGVGVQLPKEKLTVISVPIVLEYWF
jgi:hypothetical protein